MRCRRVRSYLSAYCNDDLSSRLKPIISGHLSACPACRREEAVYRSMSGATGELSALTVGSDFNSQLLNRIARERFAETRSKAYLPKRAPLVLWRQAIPAFVSTSLMVALAIVAFSPMNPFQTHRDSARVTGLDDSYLTAQPSGTDRKTARLDREWTLGNRLAWAERMNRLSNAIARRSAWFDVHPTLRLARTSAQPSATAPYAWRYYRVRPVVTTYMSPPSPSAKEGGRAY